MIKKVTFGVKSYFFLLKVVNLRKNIEKRVIDAVLEKKNIYCRKIRIKA